MLLLTKNNKTTHDVQYLFIIMKLKYITKHFNFILLHSLQKLSLCFYT